MMKPSIGRVAVYNHPGGVDQSPSVIQRVNLDGSVELFVMSLFGDVFFAHAVTQGAEPGQWDWPPRIV